MSYLQKLPLDRLKIDRAFIKDLPGKGCEAIAALIISLGARLGLKTIAEGVETQAQADYLLELVVMKYKDLCTLSLCLRTS